METKSEAACRPAVPRCRLRATDGGSPRPPGRVAGPIPALGASAVLNLEASDSLTWVKGAHTVRLGGGFRRTRVDSFNDGGLLPTYYLGFGTGNPDPLVPSLFPGGISSDELGSAAALLATLGVVVDEADQTFNVTSTIMRSDSDITHTINANWVWELPVGEGRRWLDNRSLLSSIVGGWGLSGFVRIHSGEVINIVSQRGTINRGSRALVNTVHLDGIGVGDLRNRTGVYRHPDGRVTLFDDSLLNDGGGGDLGIFRNPGMLEAGTLPLSPVSGPWYSTVDLGLRKNIALPLSAGARMQIRVDAFNVFNRANFNIGRYHNPNDLEFGLISSAFAARQIQVGTRITF